MTLNEAKPGDVLIVDDLSRVDKYCLRKLFDFDIYASSLITFDDVEGNVVHYHKDEAVRRAISLELAERIGVHPCR